MNPFLLLLVLLLSSTPGSTGVPDLPGASLDLARIRRMAVQHDGRWMPLDTLARDYVETVTGEERFAHADPVRVFLGWTFDPGTWMKAPLIPIRNEALRAELRLPASTEVYSYEYLVRHKYLHTLVDSLSMLPPDAKMDPLQAKVSDINHRLITLQSVFLGRAIAPIPDRSDPLGPWQPLSSFLERKTDTARSLKEGWDKLEKAFLSDDREGFDRASEEVVRLLETLPAAHRPPEKLIEKELEYNRIRPFHIAWMIMALGAGLAAAAMAVKRRWMDLLAVLALGAGFACLTYGLYLRGTIAGRLPAANMFESLLFLSWGTGAFAILALLFVRHRSVPLTASVMGALSLFLADTLPLDHFIRPIAPVLLDTAWMTIHVPIIMVSYSVLALAVLVAHVQVAASAVAPHRGTLTQKLDKVHYWYVLVGSMLLFVGIVTGSMWAASSWGRYWGWDPKEVWSLVAMLGYMAILHVQRRHDRLPHRAAGAGIILGLAVFGVVMVRMAPLSGKEILAYTGAAAATAYFLFSRSPFATAVKSILAFWLIIMTYIGVNFVLGTGLHSYGFGKGAVASRVFLCGTIDLVFIGVCMGLYYFRAGDKAAPSPPSGRTAVAGGERGSPA